MAPDDCHNSMVNTLLGAMSSVVRIECTNLPKLDEKDAFVSDFRLLVWVEWMPQH